MQNSNQISIGLRARAALAKQNFRTTHSLGQNFILDDVFLSQLLDAAGVGEDENVLEIGPGPGLMTALIAEHARRVLAIEMDERLEPVLSDVLADFDNAHVIFADAMKSDIATLVREHFKGERYRVIANLPYYITADLIQMMVLCESKPESVCAMVQKEAAERLMSRPGDKNWGAFAATVRYFGDCEILEEVAPEMFNPPPHVDSCFIRIQLYERRIFSEDPEQEKFFLKVIRSCFAMRRKTLANNLKSFFGLSQAAASEAIENAGLSAQVRGEALSLEEIAKLSEILYETRG